MQEDAPSDDCLLVLLLAGAGLADLKLMAHKSLTAFPTTGLSTNFLGGISVILAPFRRHSYWCLDRNAYLGAPEENRNHSLPGPSQYASHVLWVVKELVSGAQAVPAALVAAHR